MFHHFAGHIIQNFKLRDDTFEGSEKRKELKWHPGIRSAVLVFKVINFEGFAEVSQQNATGSNNSVLSLGVRPNFGAYRTRTTALHRERTNDAPDRADGEEGARGPTYAAREC